MNIVNDQENMEVMLDIINNKRNLAFFYALEDLHKYIVDVIVCNKHTKDGNTFYLCMIEKDESSEWEWISQYCVISIKCLNVSTGIMWQNHHTVTRENSQEHIDKSFLLNPKVANFKDVIKVILGTGNSNPIFI